jgi:hypothetical protein
MGVYKYTGKKGYYIDTLREHFTGRIISGLIPRKAGYAHLRPEHKRKAINSLPVWHKSVKYLGDGDGCNCAIPPQHLVIAGI